MKETDDFDKLKDQIKSGDVKRGVVIEGVEAYLVSEFVEKGFDVSDLIKLGLESYMTLSASDGEGSDIISHMSDEVRSQIEEKLAKFRLFCTVVDKSASLGRGGKDSRQSAHEILDEILKA